MEPLTPGDTEPLVAPRPSLPGLESDDHFIQRQVQQLRSFSGLEQNSDQAARTRIYTQRLMLAWIDLLLHLKAHNYMPIPDTVGLWLRPSIPANQVEAVYAEILYDYENHTNKVQKRFLIIRELLKELFVEPVAENEMGME